MVDRIEQLIEMLEKELNTYQIDMAQCTLYELQKQIIELKQGLKLGKNFSLLGESTNG
jgi:ethanolamine ammonia-lyase large subunit